VTAPAATAACACSHTHTGRCTAPGCGCTTFRPAPVAARRLDVVLAEVEAERDELARALREIAGAARAAHPSAEDALRAVAQRAEQALGWAYGDPCEACKPAEEVTGDG